MLYAVPIHSRMPTRCKIAAWPYQCLLTQNADRCSRAAGILARARLLLVVASIIRGDGPNELCESIDQRARKVPQKQCAARLSSAAMVVCRRVPATGHGGARGAAQRSAPTWKVARRCQGTIGTDRTAQSGRQRLSALKASRAPVGEEDLAQKGMIYSYSSTGRHLRLRSTSLDRNRPRPRGDDRCHRAPALDAEERTRPPTHAR